MPRYVPPLPSVAARFTASPLSRSRESWLTPGRPTSPDATLALPTGLNFAQQDYLAQTRNPLIRRAATQSGPYDDLFTTCLARFLGLPAVRTFSSGTEAIHATLQGLLHPGDDIILDAGAPSAMFDAAHNAGATVHRSPSGSFDAVERRLQRLSRQARVGRLFVAVPAVAALTSATADLSDLVQLCANCNAQLIVDVSHDLGAIGLDGRGLMEVQGCLSQIEIVVGSLAKCFGTAGGFVGLRNPDLLKPVKERAPLTRQAAAAALTALDVIDSAEGRRRRRSLHGSALRLRNHLMADGFRVLGQPSPIVPILLHPWVAEEMTTLLHSAGPLVPLLKAPLVARHLPRWRILLSSDHGPADIDDLADLIRDVSRSFDRSRQRLFQRVALSQP